MDGDWDAVVVGAGMGGGMAARALAERGLRVLVLEKGRAGWRAEETHLDAGLADPVARLVRGFWPEPLLVDGAEVMAPLGCGVGGSSAFYAATLERPGVADLGGWPFPCAELRPWLERAEALLEVAGEQDPLGEPAALRPPPEPGPADRAIMARLRANGMHPYLLHAGLRRVAGCRSCLGRKCPLACKMDGRSAGIEPALATGRARLVTEAEVVRVLGEGAEAAGVEVRVGGEVVALRAPRVVLAAGALSTPRLLMASDWPPDPHGQVGRHLMLHLNETVAVWPGVEGDPSKAVGFRDLMVIGGERMGMVQALGVDAREGEILHALRGRLARRAWARGRLVWEAARLPARLAHRLLGTARLFVGLLEDLPHPDNRVLRDPARPGRIVVSYRVTEELERRRATFRRAMRQAFRGLRPVFLNREAEPNWGHPCGTTRMGDDPRVSVLDASGRVHGVRNLWVADAGAFPASLGVNPSLTIAALALRVGEAA